MPCKRTNGPYMRTSPRPPFITGWPTSHCIVMANALHFEQAQVEVVQLLRSYLRPAGRLVIVEYNIDRGNFAVPYPVPYRRWERLAQEAGFVHTELLATRPSRFLREIYSAASW